MTLILSSPLPLGGIQALARRNLQKWRGGAPLSHLPFLLPFPPLVCWEYGDGIRRKGVKCLFKCWWFPLLPVIVSLVNSNGLKTFPEGQTSKCHFIWWNTRASSLRSILRAFSLPNCFTASHSYLSYPTHTFLLRAFPFPAASQASCLRCWLHDSRASSFHGVCRTHGTLIHPYSKQTWRFKRKWPHLWFDISSQFFFSSPKWS